ncbi:hypothetical protein LJC04_01880 [Ruminococcaceae bacterium OttesenSCG-928-O06]|nr:hypothetical protein [Ruminococcaceae bacterium OttesenSCG-928-O06]
MTTDDFAQMPDFTVAVPGESRPVASVYCADLLSWAMGRAPADAAWCTVMGNVNAVAVAHLADVAAIVLCEDAVLDEDAREKAAQQGVIIVRTGLPAFAAGVAIAQHAGLL